LKKEQLRRLLNSYGAKREPIFFMINFDMTEFVVHPLADLPSDIRFHVDEPSVPPKPKRASYTFQAVDFATYQKAFKRVIKEIEKGNTYLLNLTFPSALQIDMGLEDIYHATDAKFKLLYKDRFVCFTPERFVKIENGQIFTYPMKGTIDAKIPLAKEKILADKKEMAEHVMVVDLLRNDLSQVATKVRVEKFRYIDTIKAGERELLQVSSKIRGDLPQKWQERLGDILVTLLPAGSITGAPKKRTTEIIEAVESYRRGYFTGIFGVFDGSSLESAVMIRFIEKEGDRLIYKSGGGITIDSDLQSEYNELKEKIYVPFF
jgi:para-aminobenzoate synthetase component 1